jgi:hypothetical protein
MRKIVRPRLVCRVCGKEFYAQAACRAITQKTCSKACRYKYISAAGSTKKGKHYPHTRRAPIKKCLVCGKKFRSVKEQNGKFGGRLRIVKYCGWKCRAKMNPPAVISCAGCGKTFKTYCRDQRYCNKKCYSLDMSKRFVGNKSPLWRGGISSKPYAVGWTKAFKEKIRDRDGRKCQVCGKHEEDCFRKLDVHHIDYDKKNLRSNNLISLCHTCHVTTNHNRDIWMEKLKVE